MWVYIINGRVTRNKIDDRSHLGYFMGCAATAWVISYWNTYQTSVTHRSHHFWFYEYNYLLYIEDKHKIGILILQKYPESLIHYSDLLNLIPCELDLTSTPFCYTKILTYEIELRPSGNRLGFNYWMMKTLKSII